MKINKLKIKVHKKKKTKRIYEPVHNIRELCSLMEKHGDKIAFSYYDKDKNVVDLSYKNFEKMVRYLALGLVEKGLNGKKIAIIGDTSVNWLCMYLATLRVGGVAIPLDKELEIEEINKFMAWVDADAIAYSSSFKDKFNFDFMEASTLRNFIPMFDSNENQNKKIMSFDSISAIGKQRFEAGWTVSLNLDFEQLAVMLFTSGTTGTSKCVMLSQKNIFSCALSCVESVDFSSDDVVLSILPIHHTYELTIVMAEFIYGIHICINDSLRHLVRNLEYFKPTALTLVPIIVENMHQKIWATAKSNGLEQKLKLGMIASETAKKAGIDIRKRLFSSVTDKFGGRLEKIICGGAALDPTLIKMFENFGISIYEGYGITECSPLVAVTPYYARKYGSVGPSVPCCKARIMGTGIGDFGYLEGEIQVKGDNVMLGYYDNDHANALAFTEDGWFRTGDVGYIDDDGYIYITGRMKSVIVLNNGKNVFPEEIEEYLLHINEVKECVVVGRTDYDGKVTIVAVIYPNYEEFPDNVSEEQILDVLNDEIDKLNRKLPIFKRINDIEIRETEFEKTTSKKIKRHLVV